MEDLIKAINKTSKWWLPEYHTSLIIGEGADANIFDVWWLGRQIVNLLELELPQNLPSKENGRKTVDCVEAFIDGKIIRYKTPEELVNKAKDLVNSIQRQGLLNGNEITIFVEALFIWHGCVCMAKLLREEDKNGTIITDEYRLKQYERLKAEWEYEYQRVNHFVKYGVTLTRLWETPRAQAEGRSLKEDWIANDSPYWS